MDDWQPKSFRPAASSGWQPKSFRPANTPAPSPDTQSDPNYQQQPGLLAGMERGFKQAGVGAAQLGQQMGIPMKATPEELAATAAQLEAQGKGTGVSGFAGEVLGNPLTYLPAGRAAKVGEKVAEWLVPKAGQIAKNLGMGTGIGLQSGLVQGAVAPSANKDETLGERAANTAVSGVAGALTGGATSGAGMGLAKAAGKIKQEVTETPFTKGMKFFGFDLSKANSDQAISQEIRKGTESATQKITAKLAAGAPEPEKSYGINKIGKAVVNTFKRRKGQETEFWNKAESDGAKVNVDVSPDDVSELRARHKELTNIIARGSSTEQDKASLNLIDRTLAELGYPVGKEDVVTKSTTKTGKVQKDIVSKEKLRPVDQKITTTSDRVTKNTPTSHTDIVSEPSTQSIKMKGTQGRIVTGPKVVSKMVTKYGKKFAPTQATAANIVRLFKDHINSSKAGLAHPEDMAIVTKLANEKLDEASAGNPEFKKVYDLAKNKTKNNADLYRDEAKLNSLGLTEKKLNELNSKLKSAGRMTSQSDAELFNNIADTIKSKEDVNMWRRRLDLPEFRKLAAIRVKNAMIDANMDANKFKELKPMLDEIFKSIPGLKKEWESMAGHYEAVADKFTKAGISGDVHVEEDPGRAAKLIASTLNVLGMAYMYSNSAKKAAGSLVKSFLMPETGRLHLGLNSLKNATMPQSVYGKGNTLVPRATGSVIGKEVSDMLNGGGQ